MENQIRSYFVWLILVPLIVAPSGLAAKERVGTDVVIFKKDGTSVSGELISIKREFITVMDAGSGVNVDLKEIREISVKGQKKKAGTGLLIGLASGFALGFVASGGMSRLAGTKEDGFVDFRGIGAILGAPLGGIIGLIAGISSASGKTYNLEGVAINTTEEILSRLDKQARFRSGIQWRKNWI